MVYNSNNRLSQLYDLCISFRSEKQYQESMGKRPPTIVATDLTREAKKYEEAHAKASESNQALHRAMTLHVNNLQVLAQPLADLIANIPSPSANLSGTCAIID